MGWIFSFRQFRPSIIYHVMLGWMVIHCTHAESVTLMTVPKMVPLPRWSWHWPVYGPSGPTIEQWTQDWPGGNQNQRIRYSVCDSSARTQPNQWLTSTDIPVGPANKVYITIEYAVADCSVINNQYCRHNISLYIHKSAIQLGSGSLPDPYTNIGIFDKIGTSSPKVVTTGTMNQVENTETFSAMVDATKPYVYLAFHYQGGCMRLFSVSVQYYLCPSISLSSNFVSLPQTIAPADNSTKVHGTCSSAQHVKPLTNESNLYGYCQENGEWSTDMYNGECGCDYGYGKFATVNSGAECRACPSGMYSNKVSNSNCTKCPLNSEQNSNRTSCDCKPTFYRTDQETKFDNCSGQPSAPQNLSITFVNASSVSVTWSPPSDSGGRTDLYYTAECNRCDDQGTECTRECPGADTTVNQNTRLVRINGLSAYTYYQLRVYAKNGISKLAETKKDMAKHDEVKMRTSETVPGIPVVTVKQLSPTSVFLSWEVEEKNGIITYYQVSYHPVGQPSEVKVFNTTATNATITGLRTGNEYQFKVRASSSIGLGRSASQTKKVGIQENNAKTDITVPVLGAIVGLLLLAFAVVVIVYFVRKRRADTSGQKQSVTFAPPSNDIKMIDETHFPEGFSNPPEPHGLGSPESRDDLYMVVADDTLWEVPRENISVIKRLGCGNFGYVDKALAIGLPGIPGQVIVAG